MAKNRIIPQLTLDLFMQQILSYALSGALSLLRPFIIAFRLAVKILQYMLHIKIARFVQPYTMFAIDAVQQQIPAPVITAFTNAFTRIFHALPQTVVDWTKHFYNSIFITDAILAARYSEITTEDRWSTDNQFIKNICQEVGALAAVALVSNDIDPANPDNDFNIAVAAACGAVAGHAVARQLTWVNKSYENKDALSDAVSANDATDAHDGAPMLGAARPGL
jgi:hypothetical protein